MRLIKSNKNQVNITDKAANGIANGILKCQHLFANNLERISVKWKEKQQWIFLYSVCFIFGGLSLVAIIDSFKISENTETHMPPSITAPKNLYIEKSGFLITENEFQQVKQYKSNHPNLVKERPGLFDSLTLIEQVYYSQKK